MQQRHLAAILFTDIVGYTAMMQENEIKAVAVVKRYHSSLEAVVTAHDGKILNDYGDGSLCSFPSATEAVQAALELQEKNRQEPLIPLRVGLHVGEIFFEDGNVYGDSVNVASRIQSLGQANAILFSGEINNKLRNRPEFTSVSLGKFEFKNVDEPIEVFALSNTGLAIPKKEEITGKLKHEQKKNLAKKLIPFVTIILLAIAGVFIYSKFINKPKFTGKDKSIAVLPFENMSADKENEYFSDGITDEINTQLSKIGQLTVIATASTKLYKDSKKNIKEIANELGVSFVLKGGVQRAGNEIRISPQLIDANTQKNIWAEKYDREFKDIFNIQSEVAQEIAYQLNAQLTKDEKEKIEKKPTDNPKAYEHYLQAFHMAGKFFETLNEEYYSNSKLMYEKAIEADPKYALAYAGLADLFNTYIFFVKEDSLLNVIQHRNIERAWSIDSTLDYVNLSLGYVMQYDKKIVEAYKYFRTAMELAPNNANNLYGLAQVVLTLGLVDEAKKLIERSIKINPLNAADFALRSGPESALYNLDNAIKDLQTSLRLESNAYFGLISLAKLYCKKNRFPEAKKVLMEYEKLNKDIKLLYPNLAYIYAKLGSKKKALELSKNWEVYLVLGMKEECMEALSKNESETDKSTFSNDYIFLKNNSQHKDFDLIRNDPRFLKLMEKKRIQYEENKKKFNVDDLLN